MNLRLNLFVFGKKKRLNLFLIKKDLEVCYKAITIQNPHDFIMNYSLFFPCKGDILYLSSMTSFHMSYIILPIFFLLYPS